MKTCPKCNKELIDKRKDAIYCSRSCKTNAKKCRKSREKTLQKWKLKGIERIKEIEFFKDLLKGEEKN